MVIVFMLSFKKVSMQVKKKNNFCYFYYIVINKVLYDKVMMVKFFFV